jgi:hypothetical protein
VSFMTAVDASQVACSTDNAATSQGNYPHEADLFDAMEDFSIPRDDALRAMKVARAGGPTGAMQDCR